MTSPRGRWGADSEWRLRIRHTTRYAYDAPVEASYNEARITPLSTPSQVTIDARVVTSPPTTPFRYWDYWGALVDAFDLHEPHDTLEVTGTSLVATNVAVGVAREEAGWVSLAEPAVLDDLCELLAPSAYVPASAELAAVAAEVRSRAPSPVQAAEDIAGIVHDRLAYEPGTTVVTTEAGEAWAAGRGVCQDFAHVCIGILRAAGIPARYVSGYLHPTVDAPPGDTVRGESHAWVEAWTGWWQPLDPTTAATVGERHVIVARGRDYRDVAPLRGIYTGAATERHEVEVAITRLA